VSPVVAFQGVHGAYSEQAIRQHFGDTAQVHPCPTLNELFEAIETRQVDYAMLPVENAMAGAVNQAYEMLMEADLRINAEVIVHVHHALLAPVGTKLEDVRMVRSHPQALAQCDRYLKRNRIKPIAWYDTAGSARDLAQNPEAGVAAIASELAGQLYNLTALAREIEDVHFNYTRFLLLGHTDPARGENNKTSLVFATRNQPGALYGCIGEFATRGIDITKIESRPRRNRPWEPVFYLDVEAHLQDEPLKEAILALVQRASFVKLLGSYPAAKSTNFVGI
jgi:prephenate dehydratase